MDIKQEYTQEQVKQRAKENSEMYFELVDFMPFMSLNRIASLDLEDSFYW